MRSFRPQLVSSSTRVIIYHTALAALWYLTHPGHASLGEDAIAGLQVARPGQLLHQAQHNALFKRLANGPSQLLVHFRGRGLHMRTSVLGRCHGRWAGYITVGGCGNLLDLRRRSSRHFRLRQRGRCLFPFFLYVIRYCKSHVHFVIFH